MASPFSHEKALPPTSGTCPVCLLEKTEARLLPCFHSFCRKCIDQQAVAEDSEHGLRCPVCRAECSLPESGASGLLKDVTVTSWKEETLACRVCREEGGNGSPSVWCVTCKTALCGEHIVKHITTTGHNVTALPPSPGTTEQPSHSTVEEICPHHSLPLTYFCEQCDVAICGHCCIIGDHKTHQPVLLVEGVIAKKRVAVAGKARELRHNLLPRLQNSTRDVAAVKAQFGRETDQVRDQIEAARQRAVDTIDAYAKQLVQDVDDIELQRTKLLDEQLRKLKSLTESLTTAIRFSDELVKSKTVERMSSLLLALDCRMRALSKQSFLDRPVTHLCVAVTNCSDDNLLQHSAEITGRVKSCNASASHSSIYGPESQHSKANVQAAFTIITRDEDGEPSECGGHSLGITTKWLNRPDQDITQPPPVQVTDTNNGCYQLSLFPELAGQYLLEVYINGCKMSPPLSVVCEERSNRFDLAKSHPKEFITLSADRRTATHSSGYGKYVTVLGEHGIRQGLLTWKIRVSCHLNFNHFVGVAAKTGLFADRLTFSRSFSWDGRNGEAQILRDTIKTGRLWEKGDILELQLNCDDHTLRLTNIRTGKTDTISGLPSKEFFPFCWFEVGASMSFVD